MPFTSIRPFPPTIIAPRVYHRLVSAVATSSGTAITSLNHSPLLTSTTRKHRLDGTMVTKKSGIGFKNYIYMELENNIAATTDDLIIFLIPIGLEECIRFIANFKLSKEDIAFLQECLSPKCEDAFFDYLESIDCSDVEVYAIAEGSIVFPKVPLMRIEGLVAVVQLLETPFVNLINFASLVTTNATIHRFVAGKDKLLLEFGLQRA
ncbi:hypothetical protein LXL04_010422 [Taraxacum kok-saghyz]